MTKSSHMVVQSHYSEIPALNTKLNICSPVFTMSLLETGSVAFLSVHLGEGFEGFGVSKEYNLSLSSPREFSLVKQTKRWQNEGLVKDDNSHCEQRVEVYLRRIYDNH
jgi:hypothetical protein